MNYNNSVLPQNQRFSSRGVVRRVSVPAYAVDVNSEFIPSVTPLLVTNHAAIRQKIMNLLSVLPGEEEFEPLWGSALITRLFNLVTNETAAMVRFDTIDALTTFMKDEIQVYHARCRVDTVSDGEEAGYQITVVYQDKKTRLVDEYKFTVIKPR